MTAFFNLKGITAFVFAGVLGGAATLASAQDKSDWPDSFSVGTASQGGTYFVYGAGWANMVSEALGIPGGTEVTGGPVQNAALVQTGDLDMGMVTMGPAFDAINGNSALAPGLKHDKLRALFPMYKTGFHAVTLSSSGITSFAEIPDGAVVGVGPAGGTPGTYWPRILTGMGKDVEFRNGGASDLAGQLQDGLIDVMTWAGGLPYPAFSQLDAQTDVTYFGFTADEQAAVIDSQPVAAFTIPADIYPSLPEEQLSVSMWNFAVGNADLPESLVYEVVKTVMTNNAKMVEIHKSAVETLPENFDKNTFIPWHPGAVRWFEENGFDIPDELEG
ncbi:C4-dicarboxylate ABC transporter substrate-binding protein [Tateyamaria omphalii]|uniref:TAXI family TRAP transporter solute-binding subunit n=1 Tax=Tateyamaria omphalii TaxID=299262 RepID=UPI00167A3689|nr:TAXI family TRAP transporter solute-binding subunit [Tateyamaria omphalii]GGX42873.1 C4-dicarboxylate ABC transporter substrate-binding protein [Tateyamaria omphalii]